MSLIDARDTVLCVHPGADKYGADRIFLEVVGVYSESHKVEVWVGEDMGGLSAFEECADTVEIVSIPVLRKKNFNLLGVFALLYSLCVTCCRLIRARSRGVRVVYISTSAVFGVGVVARLCGMSVVRHIHEYWLHTVVGRILAKLHCMSSNRIIMVSELVREYYRASCVSPNFLRRKFEIKSEVIHNGVAIEMVSRPLPPDLSSRKVNIVLVGRINRWKGQREFLEFLEASGMADDVAVSFVGGVYPGDEDYRDELIAFARSVCGDQARFLGHVSHVSSWYASADIAIFPSSLPDPFPTVVLEALASGACVVASAQSGSSEIVTHEKDGFLIDTVPQINIGQLKQIIERVRDSGSEEIRQQARKTYLEGYTSEAFSKRLRSSGVLLCN